MRTTRQWIRLSACTLGLLGAISASSFAQTAVNTEGQSGPKVTTQAHGDWLLECYEPAVNGLKCQMKQQVIQASTQQALLSMSLSFNPKEKANIVQYVLPLDFLLKPGVGIQVGDYQNVAAVTRCAAQGCFIEGTTDQPFIDAMRKATQAGRVVIMARNGKKIGINFSTTGFTKAYNQRMTENKTVR